MGCLEGYGAGKAFVDTAVQLAVGNGALFLATVPLSLEAAQYWARAGFRAFVRLGTWQPLKFQGAILKASDVLLASTPLARHQASAASRWQMPPATTYDFSSASACSGNTCPDCFITPGTVSQDMTITISSCSSAQWIRSTTRTGIWEYKFINTHATYTMSITDNSGIAITYKAPVFKKVRIEGNFHWRCLLDKWNKANFDRQILPGDRIVALNGKEMRGLELIEGIKAEQAQSTPQERDPKAAGLVFSSGDEVCCCFSPPLLDVFLV
eukprot:s348_g12.t1